MLPLPFKMTRGNLLILPMGEEQEKHLPVPSRGVIYTAAESRSRDYARPAIYFRTIVQQCADTRRRGDLRETTKVTYTPAAGRLSRQRVSVAHE